METLKVRIDYKDREYAAALARALAESGKRFSVSVGCGEADVVLSEKDGYLTAVEAAALARARCPEKAGAQAGSENGQRPQLILTVGFSGGCGATSVADALAQELVRYYGKRTARVTFDAFPDAKCRAPQMTLERLMYALAKEDCPEQCGNYFFADENGIYRPDTGRGMNPLALAGADETVRFIGRVLASGCFERVVADINANAAGPFLSMSEIADSMIVVTRGKLSENADMRLKTHLERTGAAEKAKVFTNFADGDFEYGSEYDPDSFGKDGVKIEGSFGIGIKEIAVAVEV